MEVVSQLYLPLDENYLTSVEFDSIADASQILAGKLVALSKSLGRKARIAAGAVESRVSTDEGQ